MNRISQTDIGRTTGNCLQAALASILDLPLDEVPHFVLIEGPAWWDQLQVWLRERFGLQIVTIDATAFIAPLRGYYIVNGVSPRGVWHSVVYKDGELVHDPYPTGLGVEPKHALLFVALDPAHREVAVDA